MSVNELNISESRVSEYIACIFSCTCMAMQEYTDLKVVSCLQEIHRDMKYLDSISVLYKKFNSMFNVKMHHLIFSVMKTAHFEMERITSYCIRQGIEIKKYHLKILNIIAYFYELYPQAKDIQIN